MLFLANFIGFILIIYTGVHMTDVRLIRISNIRKYGRHPLLKR